MSVEQDSKDDSSTRRGTDEPSNLQNVEREFGAINKLLSPHNRSGSHTPGDASSETGRYDVIKRSGESRTEVGQSSSTGRTTVLQGSSRTSAFAADQRGGDSVYSVQRRSGIPTGTTGGSYSFERSGGSSTSLAAQRTADLDHSSSSRLVGDSSYTVRRQADSSVSSVDRLRDLGTYTTGQGLRSSSSSHSVQRQATGGDIAIGNRTRELGTYTTGQRLGGSSYAAYSSSSATSGGTVVERQGTSYAATSPVLTRSYYPDSNRRSAQSTGRGYVVDLNITLRPATKNDRFESHDGKHLVPTATIDNVHYVDLNFETPHGTAKLYTDGILHSSAARPLSSSAYRSTVVTRKD